jgi:hypothetical protein
MGVKGEDRRGKEEGWPIRRGGEIFIVWPLAAQPQKFFFFAVAVTLKPFWV